MKKRNVFLVAAVAVMLCSPASFVYSAPCSDNLTYDDGSAENGYGWNYTAGNPSAMCQRFKPCSFPYKFSKFSIGLTRLISGVTDWPFSITMWKNEGGVPGEIIDNTTVTASALPVWPEVTMYDFTLPSTWATVAATETDNNSVFIGIRFDPVAVTGTFVGADESETTPLWPSFATTAAGPWEPYTFYFSSCRALLSPQF